VVTGRDFSVSFDDQLGAMTSYSWRGTELLTGPARPDFWRAPVDNDRGAKLDRKLRAWRDAGKHFEVDKAELDLDDSLAVPTAQIRYSGRLATLGNTKYEISYDVDATGLVTIEIRYEPTDEKAAPMLPRFGTLWTLNGSLDQVTWYGRGPWPTYSDRKQAPIGIYSGPVADQFIHYSRPQENCNKVDVRWVAVTNSSGVGLLATGRPALSVGISEFSAEQMEKADYDFQLEPHNRTYLNLDLVQMGVGGNDSWGSTAMPAYLLPNQHYHYEFTIRGIDQPPVIPD
jgi:beta-galactosidase